MFKFFKWLYANKVTLTGLFALVFYVLDEIFDFTGDMKISQEAYYAIASIVFIIVGYAIKGRGFESIEQYKEVIEKQRKLKESKTLSEKVDVITEILLNDKKEESEQTE